MKEHIDFTRTVGAPMGFPIHDGLINDRGWNLIVNRINDMTETRLHDYRDGKAHAV